MSRYQWQKVCEQPQRHQLVDSVTGQPVVFVEENGDVWKWERRTNYLLHLAHPASGAESTLIKAKIAAIQDIPNED